jgi:hypothetical protein
MKTIADQINERLDAKESAIDGEELQNFQRDRKAVDESLAPVMEEIEKILKRLDILEGKNV